jgi:hypothetical protein
VVVCCSIGFVFFCLCVHIVYLCFVCFYVFVLEQRLGVIVVASSDGLVFFNPKGLFGC